MRRFMRLAFGIFAASLLAASAASAAAPSIAGDPFDLTVTVDDGLGGTVTSDSFSGVAAAVADDYYSAADLNAYFTVGVTDYDVRVNWVDADSVDIFFNALGAFPLSSLSITLSGLDLKSGGVGSDIVAASFNRGASNVDTYAAGSEMPDPSVTLTAHSVTASFSFFPAGLAADGPVLRFDVQPAIVPEPATYALMLGGLALVAGALRRRQPSA